jgi:hypothetical protein
VRFRLRQPDGDQRRRRRAMANHKPAPAISEEGSGTEYTNTVSR